MHTCSSAALQAKGALSRNAVFAPDNSLVCLNHLFQRIPLQAGGFLEYSSASIEQDRSTYQYFIGQSYTASNSMGEQITLIRILLTCIIYNLNRCSKRGE